MNRFARRAVKYIVEFAKKNSGALIIGVSLIIGLNFERFTNYAAEIPDAFRLAIYHLSGQADADRNAYAEKGAIEEREAREQQERYARDQHMKQVEYVKERQKVEAQREAKRQEEEAKRAKGEQEREQARRVLEVAWPEFLTANRTKFKQIELVKDSRNGDYNCLRIRNDKWDFVSPYASDTEKNAAEQKAEVSTYQARDSISDDFVQWLRSNKFLDRTDWKYEDLQNVATDFKFGCWSPSKVWRANRYKKRID